MYSFFRLSQMNFQVVLSACSPYFRDILRGISAWQHPVIVLKDVPYSDLQVTKINNLGRLIQLTKFLRTFNNNTINHIEIVSIYRELWSLYIMARYRSSKNH